jgi:hypothetical protein
MTKLTPAYRPRRPQDTVLHRVVRRHLETFIEHARETYDAPSPRSTYAKSFAVICAAASSSSSLNLNVHLHVVVVDGVFSRDDAELAFTAASPPTRAEMMTILRKVPGTRGQARRTADQRLLINKAQTGYPPPALNYFTWFDAGVPSAVPLVGDPDLSSMGLAQVSAWIVDAGGQLWELRMDASAGWPPLPTHYQWIPYAPPRGQLLAPNPTAVSTGDQSLMVHALMQSGNVYQGGWTENGPFLWITSTTQTHPEDNICR